jgi:hypothetical protein
MQVLLRANLRSQISLDCMTTLIMSCLAIRSTTTHCDADEERYRALLAATVAASPWTLWFKLSNDTKWRLGQWNCTYRGRREVHSWSTALLGTNAGVSSDGEPSASRSASWGGGAGWSDADFGRHHEGVIWETSVWEGVVNSQEVAVRRRRRRTKPPTS